VDNFDLKT
jgi:hypothetical protein